MRIAGYIENQEYKITIFHYQNRYSLKIENPYFEQTFKLSEELFPDVETVKKIVDEPFLSDCDQRFKSMASTMQTHLQSKLQETKNEEEWPLII